VAASGDDDDDRDDVMWSRCGSIAWKRRCPPPSRQPRRNVLTEHAGLPDGLQFDTILDTFRLFIDTKMVDHILACTNRHADEIKANSPNFRWSKPLASDEFNAWTRLKHFAGCVRCSPASPVILIDNHDSHISLPVIDFAKEHGIIMVSFPPHCSHKLQPLDH